VVGDGKAIHQDLLVVCTYVPSPLSPVPASPRAQRPLQPCSRATSNLVSSPSSTASAASPCKSGMRRCVRCSPWLFSQCRSLVCDASFVLPLYSYPPSPPPPPVCLVCKKVCCRGSRDGQVRNGHIKRITDNDIQSLVIEIAGSNVRCVPISLLVCCRLSKVMPTVWAGWAEGEDQRVSCVCVCVCLGA
jgi:hypothetical protein